MLIWKISLSILNKIPSKLFCFITTNAYALTRLPFSHHFGIIWARQSKLLKHGIDICDNTWPKNEKSQGSQFRTIPAGTAEISLSGEQTGTGDPCFVPLFIPGCFGLFRLFREVPVIPAEILISEENYLFVETHRSVTLIQWRSSGEARHCIMSSFC